jgi:prepilin-type N-terminal cleavage/methylation domain-containing protein/prepilin-type processing-associated H-X9-DG protein
MRKRNGFTLIELLVVVAIIAVLVAILLPAIARAKDSAREVSWASNLHQISLVVFYYTDMFNETLPNCSSSGWWYNWSFKLIQAGLVNSAIGTAYATAWTGNTPSSVFKGIQIARVGETKDIFNCPSLSMADMAGTDRDYYVNAYGTPQGVMGTTETDTPDWAKLRMFERRDYTLAVFDSGNLRWASNNWPWGGVGAIWARGVYGEMAHYLPTRHNGSDNGLFLDGHVRKFSFPETNWNQEMVPDRGWIKYR